MDQRDPQRKSSIRTTLVVLILVALAVYLGSIWYTAVSG